MRVLPGERGVVDVMRPMLHRGEPAVDQQHMRRLVRGEIDGGIEQRLVLNHLASARTGVGADDDARRRIVDAGGEAVGSKAAEHHRVDRADARARQHGEGRFGNHRQVDQHAIAAPDTQRLQARRHAVDLPMQGPVGVGRLDAGLGGDIHQRRLLAPRGEVAIDGVMAQAGAPADEPARERQARIVEHGAIGCLPVDALRLFAPETGGIIDGTLVQRAIRGGHGHGVVSRPARNVGGVGAVSVCDAGLLCGRRLTQA